MPAKTRNPPLLYIHTSLARVQTTTRFCGKYIHINPRAIGLLKSKRSRRGNTIGFLRFAFCMDCLWRSVVQWVANTRARKSLLIGSVETTTQKSQGHILAKIKTESARKHDRGFAVRLLQRLPLASRGSWGRHTHNANYDFTDCATGAVDHANTNTNKNCAQLKTMR